MKKTIAILLGLSLPAYADVKLSQLPLGTGSATATNDSFPYVDSAGGATKRLKLSDIQNIPAVLAAFEAANSCILKDGSRALTANWNAGSFNITASKFIGDLQGNIDDATDATKQLKFDVSGNTAAKALTVTTAQTTNQSISIPNVGAADSILTLNATQSPINKTISRSSNTLSGFTASAALIADGSGNATSEAQLAITRGGTGQSTKTAAFDALSPTTTKGDIEVNNGTNNVRLAIGSNNQVLTADSAQSSGVKWAAASAATTAPSGTQLTNTSTSTDSTGTYTVPSGALYLRIRMTGGGGGGGGGATTNTPNGGNGNAGTASSFSGSGVTLTANGGSRGDGSGNSASSQGGTASITGAFGTALTGGGGNTGQAFTPTSVLGNGDYAIGGGGGNNPFGGGGGSMYNSVTKSSAAESTGGGGAGGQADSTGSAVTRSGGDGGGSGGFIDAIVTAPAASYSYTVGHKGAGGSAGTSGFAGGNGGGGYIEITAYFQ